jgi:hypothetical protein
MKLQLYQISQLPILLMLFNSTRLPSKTSGHCFENNAEFQLEDIDTATSSTMVKNLNTRNLPFHIRSYRKLRTFHEKMNRLHQSKNQYPVDIYYINSILAVIYLTRLQNLINRPVMNCSMSIFPYFYFSKYILFDFPSSGLIFL